MTPAGSRALPGVGPLALATALVLLGLVSATAAASDPPVRYGVAFGHTVDIGWRSFEGAPLTFAFTLETAASQGAMAEFGYTTADIQSLNNECSFEQCGQAVLNQRTDAFYRSRGLVPFRTGNSVSLTVDIPAEVHRNGARVRPMAVELSRLSKTNAWGADQQLGAAVALIQSALPYKKPPSQEGGRQILGFYPPPRALEAGSGDCDTKSALLAAVMSNFSASHMVGVHIPGHYVVGISRVPRSGEAFVSYRGEPYVLIEASGPGMLPPGSITPSTQAALNTMSGVRIDPLF